MTSQRTIRRKLQKEVEFELSVGASSKKFCAAEAFADFLPSTSLAEDMHASNYKDEDHCATPPKLTQKSFSVTDVLGNASSSRLDTNTILKVFEAGINFAINANEESNKHHAAKLLRRQIAFERKMMNENRGSTTTTDQKNSNVNLVQEIIPIDSREDFYHFDARLQNDQNFREALHDFINFDKQSSNINTAATLILDQIVGDILIVEMAFQGQRNLLGLQKTEFYKQICDSLITRFEGRVDLETVNNIYKRYIRNRKDLVKRRASRLSGNKSARNLPQEDAGIDEQPLDFGYEILLKQENLDLDLE